jgi:predicted RNA-binding Zn-ribbon protein involved in translation (DUF1610 family)
MGQVHPLPTHSDHTDVPVAEAPAAVPSTESAHCALCGARFTAGALRYQVVSPQCCEAPITVCHICHKAALGEGYRPAE